MTRAIRTVILTALVVLLLVLIGCVTAREAQDAADRVAAAEVVLEGMRQRLDELEAESQDPETTTERQREIAAEVAQIRIEGARVELEQDDDEATVDVYNEQQKLLSAGIGAALTFIPGGSLLGGLAGAYRRKWIGTLDSVGAGGGARDPEATRAHMSRFYPKLENQITSMKRKKRIENAGAA